MIIPFQHPDGYRERIYAEGHELICVDLRNLRETKPEKIMRSEYFCGLIMREWKPDLVNPLAELATF